MKAFRTRARTLTKAVLLVLMLAALPLHRAEAFVINAGDIIVSQ